MYAGIRCQSCGTDQQVPVGPMPTIAACSSCGAAIEVPGASMAPPMPMAPRLPTGPRPMYQPGYPSQYPPTMPPGYRRPMYGPPPKSNNTAVIVAVIAVVAFMGLIFVGVVVGAVSEISEAERRASYESPPGIDYERSSRREFTPAREWKACIDSDGFYVIDFPVRETSFRPRFKDANGVLEMHACRALEDDATWEVKYVDIPGHKREDDETLLAWEIGQLRGVRDAKAITELMIASSNGTEFAGMEFWMSDETGELEHVRLFMVRNRLYVISAITVSDKREAEVKRFLGSFRLIGNIPAKGWPAEYLRETKKEDRGTKVPGTK